MMDPVYGQLNFGDRLGSANSILGIYGKDKFDIENVAGRRNCAVGSLFI